MQVGITSDAFENLTVDEILTKIKENNIAAVEWHESLLVPGNLKEATRIGEVLENTGCKTISYRVPYDRFAQSMKTFSETLQTAKALGTDTVTLTAAPRLADEEPDELLSFAQFAKELADLAAKEGFKLCFACAGGTLLDTYVHITHFMEIVDKENVSINWQPNRTSSLIYNIYELKMLVPYITSVNLLYAEASEECTHIIEGKDEWLQYLKVLKGSRCNSLLFTNYREETFSAESDLLHEWIQKTVG